MSHCEMCGREMIKLHPAQRYCCRACSDEYFMAERKQAVEYFRAQGKRPVLNVDQQQMEGVIDQRDGEWKLEAE